MNEQIKNELLNGTPIEYIGIVIYDCKINGVCTIDAASVLAGKSVEQMKENGYQIVERNGLHYFEKRGDAQ